MEIQVLAFNRFLNNRPLGSATLSLQRLLDESHIQLALSLIDINGRPLKVRKYFSNFSCGFLHPSIYVPTFQSVETCQLDTNITFYSNSGCFAFQTYFERTFLKLYRVKICGEFQFLVFCSEKIDQTLHVATKGRKNPIKVHAFTEWRLKAGGPTYCLPGQTNESIGNGLFKINILIQQPILQLKTYS